MNQTQPARPITAPENLPSFHDRLDECRMIASTLWAFAEVAWTAEVHKYARTYANTYGRDRPYSEVTKDANKNDDVIRLQHFAAELEELACKLDALTEALLPVAYPRPAAAP